MLLFVNMDIVNTFARNNYLVMIYIDNILKSKEITKTDLAKRMELSRESLYRILSVNPTLDNITKLANALEIPISELFDTPERESFRCPKCGTILEVKEK